MGQAFDAAVSVPSGMLVPAADRPGPVGALGFWTAGSFAGDGLGEVGLTPATLPTAFAFELDRPAVGAAPSWAAR